VVSVTGSTIVRTRRTSTSRSSSAPRSMQSGRRPLSPALGTPPPRSRR
jgi:hypothetical protein